MVRFVGMRHLALKVSDVERSARFYESAFGMRRFGGKGGRPVIPLVSPNLNDQITLSSETVGEAGSNDARPGEQGGVDHFGFVVSPGSKLDEVVERLTACGATFLRRHEVAKGVPSLFFRDPDGYLFQVTRFPRFTRLYIALLPILARLRGRPA
ncbi:MAG TPA: VOC family protein [Caulobacteraceae bacterium]|nr:VOC family protein [Caulobacteraceae bacterium]